MNCRVIRDRETPGSNPGPPTNFVFKIDDFLGGLESAAHPRYHNFLQTYETGAR